MFKDWNGQTVFITIFHQQFWLFVFSTLNQPSRNSSCGYTLMLHFIQINIRLVMHSKPQHFITLLLLKTCKRGQKAQGVTLTRSLSEADYCTRAVQWNSQTWRNVMIQHLVPSKLLASMLGRRPCIVSHSLSHRARHICDPDSEECGIHRNGYTLWNVNPVVRKASRLTVAWHVLTCSPALYSPQ